jgi:hypothetical protein
MHTASPVEAQQQSPQEKIVEAVRREPKAVEATDASLPPCPGSAPMTAWSDCIGSESDASGATTYAGPYKNGLRDGQGSYFWPGGEKYVGQFKGGKIEGRGTRTWPNGERYVGEFKDGGIDGHGTRIWPNGERYVGEFRNGRIEGEGTYMWLNGEKYVGQWSNGIRHGTGTQYNAAGAIVYQGKWANDRKLIE